MVGIPDGDQLPELHVRHHEVPLTEGVHPPVPLIGEPTLVVLMVEILGLNINVFTLIYVQTLNELIADSFPVKTFLAHSLPNGNEGGSSRTPCLLKKPKCLVTYLKCQWLKAVVMNIYNLPIYQCKN